MKRMVVAAVGWAFMALMIYLMSVTARSETKIWDPYEILGIPMVRYSSNLSLEIYMKTDKTTVGNREADPIPLQEIVNHHAPGQGAT